jgi:hypothetical protein
LRKGIYHYIIPYYIPDGKDTSACQVGDEGVFLGLLVCNGRRLTAMYRVKQKDVIE